MMSDNLSFTCQCCRSGKGSSRPHGLPNACGTQGNVRWLVVDWTLLARSPIKFWRGGDKDTEKEEEEKPSLARTSPCATAQIYIANRRALTIPPSTQICHATGSRSARGPDANGFDVVHSPASHHGALTALFLSFFAARPPPLLLAHHEHCRQ